MGCVHFVFEGRFILLNACHCKMGGRVHSAMVAAINFDLRTATVEWYERGETKGKEVELAVIESLNPEIIIVQPVEKCLQQPMLPSPLQRDSSASPSEEEETSTAVAQLSRFGHKLHESDDDFNSNQLSPDTATLSNPTRQTIAPSMNDKNSNGGLRIPKPTTVKANNGQVMENYPISKENTASRTSMLPQNSRTSSVVKEVEKLKKNREERRQRQAEEKAEKEAFLQSAPGNPHWELLNMIQEYRRGIDIKPLTEHDALEDHLITVCVRKRPLNKKDASRKEVDVITIPSKNQLIVHEPKNKVDLTKYLENQIFRFDYAFDETCTNDIVYKYTAQPLIKTIFDGGFATCFAYGQTGSGKTHTMGGDFNGKTQDCQKGIYAMVSADVFRYINMEKYRHLNLLVCASFFEIYSGKVFDLLNNKLKLRILEDGKQQVQVVGLTEKIVSSVDEVLKLIQKGNQARTSGQTSANSNSSRSHAVFQIILRSQSSMSKIHGKFSLIDLAGNERGADTSSANRETRMEGAEINKSLLALKECIRALGRKGAHLPFRVSKLTQVLRDSFVGPNSRTCMIAMISPGVSSCEHSLNTLRYADRVKELGAGDLVINQGDDGFNNADKQGDGDLQQLRSLNEHDMSVEMLNFHQVISELQTAEDSMLDNHKQTIEHLHASLQRAKKLLRMTDDVTYDQEGYCRLWTDLVKEMTSHLIRSEETVADFKAKLATEEQLSRKTQKKKNEK
ncbi:kinesin-like protein Klp10A isoform X3 [Onthophagus taurus]|uniref:kinesin-like protein Klp10A isoform X3 n=1 Tax=Onthophagus taurus TaxID=166361 RepID=UPI000C204278|nr:kinesin-like protein KIF2A isoform X3 [Onthophagus taurus]